MKKIKNVIKKSDKKKLTIYLVLRALVIFCMIRELFLGNIMNALLCVLSLILFLIPMFVEKTFKVDLPNTLEIIIMLFIFSAEILGEINSFYLKIENFDTILHTLNGFLCAGVGLSLVDLLNNKVESFNLSPVFIVIVAFCFSMTVGVFWEFFEYGMDKYMGVDMQKDTYVSKIKTVELDENKSNDVITIDNITETIIVDKELNVTQISGYLDIGLHDTMDDLKVNFVGAAIFSAFGYVYLKTKEKFKFIKNFVIVKK
ncbi:MAG: hypothetical protein E7359_04655 [Clostridiales bacterium]|nr:hypothetical protein [Clostridiales bacterium]